MPVTIIFCVRGFTSINLILIVVPDVFLASRCLTASCAFVFAGQDLAQFRHILSVSDHALNSGWSFEIMVEDEAFVSGHNCPDVEDQKMPVVVTSHRPTCSKC